MRDYNTRSTGLENGRSMDGRFAMLHDIVWWEEAAHSEGYGRLAVVVGIQVFKDGSRYTGCRFWLPKSGVLGKRIVPMSDKDMAKADLIGAIPAWAGWDE